jgi:hypothetical protein
MQAEAPGAHLPRQTMKSSTDRERRRNAMPRTTNISAPQNPTTATHRPTGPRGLLLEELDFPYELKRSKDPPRAARTETDSSRSASRRLLKTAARPTRSRGPLSNMFSGDNRTRAVLYEHASCSRTRASRIPRRYQACFAPLSAASRLMSSLRRVPRLDPRFRGDDTCWLGAVEIWKCLARPT